MSFLRTRLVVTSFLAVSLLSASSYAAPPVTHAGRGGAVRPYTPHSNIKVEIEKTRLEMQITALWRGNSDIAQQLGRPVDSALLTDLKQRLGFQFDQGVVKNEDALAKIDAELATLLRRRGESGWKDADEARLKDLMGIRDAIVRTAEIFLVDPVTGAVRFRPTNFENAPAEVAKRKWEALMALINTKDTPASKAALEQFQNDTASPLLTKEQNQKLAFDIGTNLQASVAKARQGARGTEADTTLGAIEAHLNSYINAVSGGRMAPSFKLLENVENAISSIRAANNYATSNRTKKDPVKLEAAKNTLDNMLREQDEHGEQHVAEMLATRAMQTKRPVDTQGQVQLEQILSDKDAARGLGRLSAQFLKFNNAATKKFAGDTQEARDARVGEAMGAWIRASEIEKAELAKPGNYELAMSHKDGVEGWLKEFREKHPEKDLIARQREENKDLQQRLCKNCPELVPMCPAGLK